MKKIFRMPLYAQQEACVWHPECFYKSVGRESHRLHAGRQIAYGLMMESIDREFFGSQKVAERAFQAYGMGISAVRLRLPVDQFRRVLGRKIEI